MAYKGGVPVNSGFYPRNDFPIVEAKDIYVSDEQRLDAVLDDLKNNVGDHEHGDLYYTEQEIDDKIEELRADIGTSTGENVLSTHVTHGESQELLSNIIETYILSIDYSTIAFDTSKIVFSMGGSDVDEPGNDEPENGDSTTSMLGYAVLGQMVLG